MAFSEAIENEHQSSEWIINSLINSVRATGAIGVGGLCAGGSARLEKHGQIAIDWSKFFEKGLRMGSGQCNVKAYNRQFCRLIHEGKADPSFTVSHELPLDVAPEAYRHFGARDGGWTKVVLKPQAAYY